MCLVWCDSVFFFKQKTAYELRISDWSSDVCSSDLADVVLVLSNSGETEEVLTILPMLKRQGNAMVAMTGRPQSTLARHAAARSEERRGGKECGRKSRSRWSTSASKQNNRQK